MNAIDPGHYYELRCLDAQPDHPAHATTTLRFVKRIGDKYPGNNAPGYPGTTTQEVIRALIDRIQHVDAQIDKTNLVSQRGHADNAQAIKHLRFALCYLEARAAHERGSENAQIDMWLQVERIETLEVCPGCHHVLCNRSHVP